jgi:hypothetical protein
MSGRSDIYIAFPLPLTLALDLYLRIFVRLVQYRTSPGVPIATIKENVMLFRMIALCVLGAFLFAVTGCEANAKAGDGKAKIEVKEK